MQKHYRERQGIVQDALNSELAENRQYAAAVNKVNASTGSALSKAASDFNQSNIRAEEKYQEDRNKIITDGAKSAAKIQENLQKQLAKLAEDHAERRANLTAARDALGLAKENRQYRRDVNDAKKDAGREKKELQQSITERLADLKQSYESERAGRLADYQARVKEIQAQAAERLKELAVEHAEELRKIQEQKAAKLRELDQQFIEERKRRYNQFIQNLRDIDAALLGETKLRQAYNAKMLTDLDVFLETYRAKLATLGSGTASPAQTTYVPLHHAAGGYASYGMHLLGDAAGGGRGKPEYVLNGNTTELVERILGGQITQDRLLSKLSLSGGGGRSITYNDSRRIGGPVTGADRNRLRGDIEAVLTNVIGAN